MDKQTISYWHARACNHRYSKQWTEEDHAIVKKSQFYALGIHCNPIRDITASDACSAHKMLTLIRMPHGTPKEKLIMLDVLEAMNA